MRICNEVLKKAGKEVPRDCPICQFGPCRSVITGITPEVLAPAYKPARKPLSDLHDELSKFFLYAGLIIKHKKTGGYYRIAAITFRESDMSIEFIYSPIEDFAVIFARPIDQLFDGRFEIQQYILK